MKNWILIPHEITFILLVFGFGSCTSDKSIKPVPVVEIKLKTPLMFNNKENKLVSISSIVPESVVNASDWIQFTGFNIRSTDNPIQLITRTVCTHSDEEQVLKITRHLPSTLQISELLPREYFFNPQKLYPSDFRCFFDFKALEPFSQASHSFSLKINVTIFPQIPPAIKFSHNQALITEFETRVTLSPRQLESSSLSSNRSNSFQLHCQNFIAELNLRGKKPRLGKELWLDPNLISHQAAKENPIQLCRILGYRQKFITSWSDYFYLQTPQEPPQLEWLIPTNPLTYKGRQELPKLVAAQARLYNSNTYPQLIQVHKNLPIYITPICVRNFRSSQLKRSSIAIVTVKKRVQLIHENDHLAIYKVFPGSEILVEYILNGRVDCDCPQDYEFADRRIGDLIYGSNTLSSIRALGYRNNEAGFFMQMSNLSSAMEMVAINSHTNQGFQLLQPIGSSLPPPLRWVENQIPNHPQRYTKTVDDLYRAGDAGRKICH